MLDNDRYVVETPEIVSVAYEVAGLGSRCLAALIDTLLILSVLGVLGALLTIIGSAVTSLESASDVLLALWAIGSFAIFWGYYLLFELLWSGQSPGKRLIGLRVVRDGGRPITFAASAIRNLIRPVDFLPFFYGLGSVAMFADQRGRRLGDLAAGSLVVREAAPLSLDALTTTVAPVDIAPRPPGAPAEPLLPHLDRITPSEYEVVQDFLRRRDTIDSRYRKELAAQLAAVLRERLAVSDATVEPEPFLEHLLREYRFFTDRAALGAGAGGTTRPDGE